MKTISLKKVSAVAVASLGFGLLSVVPANAAAGDLAPVLYISDATTVDADGALGTYSAQALSAVTAVNAPGVDYTEGSITGSVTSITLPKGATLVLNYAGSAGDASTSDFNDLVVNGVKVMAEAATAAETLSGYTITEAAGTYSAKVQYYSTASTRNAGDLYEIPFTLTVVAGPTLSASNSTSFICSGAVATCAADEVGIAVTKATSANTAGTQRATIIVTPKNTANSTVTSTTALTAAITSGPGMLGITTAANANSTVDGTGPVPVGRSITGAAGKNAISIFSDGNSGTATITISNTNTTTGVTTVLATETISFYGAVASVTVTQNLSVALAGGQQLGSEHATAGTTLLAPNAWTTTSGSVPAVVVTMLDSNGVKVPGNAANLSAVSSDLTVMSSTIASNQDATVAGTYNVAVNSATTSTAGKTATLTFRVLITGTTYVSAAPVTFKIGSSSVGKVSYAFDKTSYAAGDPAVLTISGTDASGNALADGLYAAATTVAPAFSKSVIAISTMPTTTTAAFVGGSKAYKFYAPTNSGAFVASGTYVASTAAAIAATATASVTDANAALTTQIDALNAKIVALNALIAKIMKKLGVK